METEIEATFTNINPEEMRGRLVHIGAKLMHPERVMRRKVYDYPDGKLRKICGWVRLRDEGDKITLAYKQLHDRTINGTKEVSIRVENFKGTEDFLAAVGLELKSYQETKRESWLLGETEIEIDTWPWIPTFVEIEGKDEKTVRDVARKLGFDWSAAKHGSVENVYQEVYDVTEDDIDSWKEITFSPVPTWLEAKRKQNL